MTEYIDREALIEEIAKIKDLRTLSTKAIGEAIDRIPVTDVEPVVRCRDCKNSYFADNRVPGEQKLVCWIIDRDITPDFYCAYGLRKEVTG